MMTILTIVLIVAVVVMTTRIWTRRRRRGAWAEQPGRSAHNVLEVVRFDEMDETVRAERCHCGGRLSVVSEGSQTVDGQQLRVIRADCRDCDQDLYFFFKIRKVLH